MEVLLKSATSLAADVCFSGEVPEDFFCGDCWHDRTSNTVCMILFGSFSLIFLLTMILMICYHYKRKRAKIEVVSKSFYSVFVFISCWMLARIIYFSDAFYNYNFDQIAILAILPLIFTYITISIAIYNVLNLCQVIEVETKNSEHDKDYLRCIRICFFVVASFCILTQIVCLFMAVLEPPVYRNGFEIQNFQDNTNLLIRNILTTITVLVLSAYNVYYTLKLIKVSKGISVIKAKVRTKIIMQAFTIEFVLILRCIFAWVQKDVYGLQSDWIWPTFILFYELLSEIIPYLIFCVMLYKQVGYLSRVSKKIGKASVDPNSPDLASIRSVAQTNLKETNELSFASSGMDVAAPQTHYMDLNSQKADYLLNQESRKPSLMTQQDDQEHMLRQKKYNGSQRFTTYGSEDDQGEIDMQSQGMPKVANLSKEDSVETFSTYMRQPIPSFAKMFIFGGSMRASLDTNNGHPPTKQSIANAQNRSSRVTMVSGVNALNRADDLQSETMRQTILTQQQINTRNNTVRQSHDTQQPMPTWANRPSESSKRLLGSSRSGFLNTLSSGNFSKSHFNPSDQSKNNASVQNVDSSSTSVYTTSPEKATEEKLPDDTDFFDYSQS